MEEPVYKKTLLTFSIVSFFITGCYNNAHLRTQKQLTPGEKVYSGSGIVAMGGVEDYYDYPNNTGVSGFRAGLSMLKGGDNLEAGPYLGAGILKDGVGVFAGYDYRRYLLNKAIPQKLGAQMEVNLGDPGATFHLRPSLTTITTKNQFLYGGLQATLAMGDLTQNLYAEDYQEDGDVSYRFTSLGLGVTAGIEASIFKNVSYQIQVDASMVKSDFVPNKEIQHDGSGEDVLPMITGSIGVNLFKPSPKSATPFEPMPSPQRTLKSTYNPETGEKVIPGEMRFDPETGELISNEKLYFDPETGKEIKINPALTLKKEDLPLIKGEKSAKTKEEIISMAHSAAQQAHPGALYKLAGAGSCFIAPIGIPLSILFNVLGPVLPITTLDTNHPLYLELTDFEDQNLFKKSYKKKERTLRSASCHNTQLGCFAVYGATLMFSIAADSNI